MMSKQQSILFEVPKVAKAESSGSVAGSGAGRELANAFEIVSHPSLRLWWIYCFGFAVVLVAKLLLLVESPDFAWLWRSGVAMGVVILGYLYLKRKMTVYRLNAIELTGRVGVFSKRVTRIPINRITNYDSHASLVERLLGLNNVLIDTPGGVGYEMVLKQLCYRDAELYTNRLRELIGQQKIADAGTNSKLRLLREMAIAE